VAARDEPNVGTNALDLAIRIDKTVAVYSAEHFSACVHDWTCWAAPIHDPGTGRQLGVLDMSTTWDNNHPMGAATVTAFARLLEHALPVRIPADSSDPAAARWRVLATPSKPHRTHRPPRSHRVPSHRIVGQPMSATVCRPCGSVTIPIVVDATK
jgi:transcriptional regulator of acetoin/glycerol metabolism